MHEPRKYVRIYLALKEEILTGKRPAGTLLNIREISVIHASSRDVVQRSMELLSDERLIWRIKGLGWFVVSQEQER